MASDTLNPPSPAKPASAVFALSPLAVDADDAAALLGISPAQFYRLLSADRLPAPVRLSERCPRWPVKTLERWLALGGPTRGDFERMTDASRER